MRYLIISLILLLISFYIGTEIAKVDNYVLVVYNHWAFETSLWVFLLIIIILFVLLYFIIRLITKLITASKRYHYWKISHRSRKAQILTQNGLCELAQGEWRNAEESLIAAAKLSKKPLINYLAAAKAAHSQQALERRDNYLRLAIISDKNATLAIGFTQAQLQIDSKQWEQALASLQLLYQRFPKHPYILKLLAQVHVKLNEWSQCEKLLPKLRKYKVFSEKEYAILERKIYFALLQVAHDKDPSILKSFWQSLPRIYQHDSEFAIYYAEALLSQQQDEAALEHIETFVNKSWQPKLITLYGKILSSQTNHQLRTAEHWLKKHPHDIALLLCLSHLYSQEKLWDQAKVYLQQAIEIKPTAAAYIDLGKIHESLQEIPQAQQCFRLAAECFISHN